MNRRRFASFTSRLVLVQFALTVVVLGAAVIAAGVLVHSIRWEQAESTALSTARMVAHDQDVRREVERYAELQKLDPTELVRGELQRRSEEWVKTLSVSFVVITDEEGMRLTHPDPEQIGHRVSTEPLGLDGREHVSRETGTIGESVRAKVPVRAPGSREVVGEVSAGVAVVKIDAAQRAGVLLMVAAGALAVVVAGLTSWWLARRLRRATLGLGPEEMAQLVRDQRAVLHGVDEGVIGLGPSGQVTLLNRRAMRLVAPETGLVPLDPAAWPAPLTRVMADGAPGPVRLVLGQRPVVYRRQQVKQSGRDLGSVVTLRDLTDLEDLGTRLEGVETMAQAMRVQRHEFANRLHTVSGLLALGEVDEAQTYLRSVMGSGQIGAHVRNIELVQDTYLAAFLGAKAVQAAERGVEIRVGEGSNVTGQVQQAQDVTAVVGNLLDNAVHAAVSAGGHGGVGPWVEIDLILDDGTLHVAVVDSGAGVRTAEDVFADGVSTGRDEEAHGLGLGLPLARRIARRRGGDVWIADRGGQDQDGERWGAVFAARLPNVAQEDE
jgi:two-component system CitB family sensor kinase